jgi:D-threo-aldose 1-dehydrogenase
MTYSVSSVTVVTRLSLGGSQLGNLFREIDDEQAAATVAAAWDAGIRYFDTAPHYGLGLSERRLGAALRTYDRSEFVVSTKVGRLLEPLEPPRAQDDEGFAVAGTHRRVWDFSRDGVLRSLEESLERLGLERVDIVYLHDPDDHWQQALDEAYPALEELRAQGLVDSIGAGMNQAAMLADFVRHTDMNLLMLAGRYTLLDRSAEDDLLPACLQRGARLVAAGVFNSGLLARARPSEDSRFDYGAVPPDVFVQARRLADTCDRHGVGLPAAALQFPLRHPAVASVCVGARSPKQIRRNAEWFAAPIPDELWEELEELSPAVGR